MRKEVRMSAELFDKKSLQIETLETNKQKITFAVSPERFKEGVVHSYNKTKSRFNIPGFRKGKAPRQIIEMQYGKEIFFPDAVDYLLDEAYESVINESGLDIVGRAEADIESISAEDGVVFIIEAYTRPFAEVGDYKKLTYNEVDITPTDDEINERIEQTREKNGRLVSISGRPAEIGDIVTIDYEGSIDGIPFEGGSNEDYDLTLGSSTFIEGFENQLVGAAIDDELEVFVTFPSDYDATELAGRPAVFKCLIKDIRSKELPPLNDDFAQDVSEFDTFDEYYDSVAAEIQEEKSEAAKRERDNQIMEKLIAETKVEIPPVMIEQQMDQFAEDFKTRIESSGMPFNYYLEYSGQTAKDVREGTREPATEHVTARLALEAIAEKENISVTDEDLEAELERIAELYKMKPEALKSTFGGKGLKQLESDLKVQKAADFVLESAIANI